MISLFLNFIIDRKGQKLEKDFVERLVAVEERGKSTTKRIDEHDKDIEDLKKTYAIMQKMDYRMSNVEKGLDTINQKLDKHDVEIQEEINKEDKSKSKKWDKLVDYLFYAFLGLILSYIAMKLHLK